MLLRVDVTSAIALNRQIVDQVRLSISTGELDPGERLPPARDLAKALQVNMHTVLRAYAELRDEGLIEMRQGRGAFVRNDLDTDLSRLTQLAEQLIHEAQKLGLSQSDVVHLIKKVEAA